MHSIFHGIGPHATETHAVHVKDIVGAKHRRFHVDSRLDGLTRIVTALARIVATLARIIATAIASIRIWSILAFNKVEVVDIKPSTGHIHAENMFAFRKGNVRLYIAEVVKTCSGKSNLFNSNLAIDGKREAGS